MKSLHIYIFFLLCCNYAKTQVFPDLKFSHITEKEGLSNNWVTVINQDKDGFIWAGTADGLNRLDGYRIKTFFHRPADSGTLVNNYIRGIAPDSANNLWISTGDGMSYYNKQQDAFINGPSNIFFKKEGSFCIDRNNTIWMALADTVFGLNNPIQYYSHPINPGRLPANYNAETTNSYMRLYTDKDGHFWAYSTGWVFLLDDNTKQIKHAFNEGSFAPTALLQDTMRQFWLGTFSNGLYLFNNINGGTKKITLTNNANIISSMCEWKDKNNNNWIVIGTEKGVVLLDPVTKRNYSYSNNNYDYYSIIGNRVAQVFVGRDNILWLGTNQGISYIEPSRQFIETWDVDGTPPLSKTIGQKIEGYIYSFYIDSNGYWGSNWNKPGLNFYNKNGQLEKTIKNLYPPVTDSAEFKTSRAYAIAKAKNGTWWYTTEIGVVNFDPKAQTYNMYKPVGASNHEGFRTMLQFDDSTWWIRTRNNGNNGIYVFNTAQKKFTAHYYVKQCETCTPLRVFDMYIAKNKLIYAAPYANGLYKFNPAKNMFTPLNIYNLPKQLIGNSFDCITEDSKGMIWVGTLNGLFVFNPNNNTLIKDYSTNNKIGGVEILKLCFDDDDNLWMTTGRGMFWMEHTTGEILQFTTGDGLPSSNVPGFLSKGNDGYIYAGAIGYIVRFKPEELLLHKVTAQIGLSQITVMDKPYALQKDANGNNLLILKPEEDFFTIDYSVLNYDNPVGNRYFYKLDNLNNRWKETENGHLVFNNLPAGKYVLHMQGSHKFGSRFTNEAILAIQVLPYWWQTNLFKITITITIVLLIFLLVMRRINTIKKEARLKQQIVETEMIALRSQMNPHFIFNCLNSIDNLIQNDQKEKATTYLSKFAKLMRAILENSKYETIPCWKELDCLQLYIDLEKLRLGDKFTSEFIVDEKIYIGDYEVPPTVLQPFVENAIHHGLLNKLDGDKVLTVMVKTNGNNIKCVIRDNGVGRTQAEVYKNLNNPKYHSMGVKNTTSRIHLFNDENGEPTDSILITDLYDNNVPCGTMVEILLKN